MAQYALAIKLITSGNTASKTTCQMVKSTGSFMSVTREHTKMCTSFVRNYLKFLHLVEFGFKILVLPLSIFFLSATIFIFGFIKELRATTYGKSILCLLTAVVVSFVSFPFIIHRWIDTLEARKNSVIISFFATIISGFWLNVLSFDIWWKIRQVSFDFCDATFKIVLSCIFSESSTSPQQAASSSSTFFMPSVLDLLFHF